MARTVAKAGPALALALAVLAAVLLAAKADASSAPAVHSSTHRRHLKQDKCDQCNSCTCDANCDCIDGSTTAPTGSKCDQCNSCTCDANCDCIDGSATAPTGNKCDQCNSCTCDANCDCIDGSATAPTGNKCDQCNSCTCDANCDCIDDPATAPTGNKCDQCNSCTCDANCDCITGSSTVVTPPVVTPPEATRTTIDFSDRNVALGKGVTALDIVAAALVKCNDRSCDLDPIVMPMELWAKGSSEQDFASCTAKGDGYYTPGTCTARVVGTTIDLAVRDALVDAVRAAAEASQTPALGGVQHTLCRGFPGMLPARQDETANWAMPSYIKVMRTVTLPGGTEAQSGEITMNLECAFDTRSEEQARWDCVGLKLGGIVGGTINPAAGVLLGTLGAVCGTGGL